MTTTPSDPILDGVMPSRASLIRRLVAEAAPLDWPTDGPATERAGLGRTTYRRPTLYDLTCRGVVPDRSPVGFAFAHTDAAGPCVWEGHVDQDDLFRLLSAAGYLTRRDGSR